MIWLVIGAALILTALMYACIWVASEADKKDARKSFEEDE